MVYLLYGTWTIEEAHGVGKTFEGVCRNATSIPQLIEGETYALEIISEILPTRPLCRVTTNGKIIACHLERFEKA